MKHTHKMAFFSMVMIMLVFIIIIKVHNVSFLEVYSSWDDKGENESKNSETLVSEKIRVLLGLRTINKETEQYNEVWENYSPAPAPSPAETRPKTPVPGPAPKQAFYLHQHHQPPRPMLPLPVQHKENSKRKIIIISVILSTIVVSVIFALGLFYIRRKFNKPKNITTKKSSVFSDEDGYKERSNLARKIGNVMFNLDNSEQEDLQSGVRDETSFAEEIISVHGYGASSKNNSDDQSSSNGDRNVGVGIDHHSSEDESFHSFCDSRRSSNLRISNVSFGSFGDLVGTLSPNQSNRSLGSSHSVLSIQPLCNEREETGSIKDDPQCTSDNMQPPQTSPLSSSTPPTPPPPPPLPPLKRPPLYINNKGKSVKGPPCPPGKSPAVTPKGKDGNPLPKLKPLHWDKVRATPDRSMVWDKLHCSSFELDEETIESLFGYSLKTAFTNDERKSKSSPSPRKHVLEPKRLQNITILSKALNVTAEKVCEALLQGDGLSTQQLEALIKMEPTKEEVAKLSSYRGAIDELGSAEKLVKELLNIPHAFQRVGAMLYKATFDDEVVHLRNSFSMLEEACKELRSSRLFLKLLEAVLKTGNRMNVGTIRGGARAFKLDTLLKLADVKGTDGKTTLLHFVVQEIILSEGIRMSDSIMGQIDRSSKSRTIEEKENDYNRMGLDLVSGLSTELHNVKRTASLDLDVLTTSVSNLSDGMFKIQQLVNKELDGTNNNFVHIMRKFSSYAEYSLKDLQNAENMVLLCVRQITEYYHGTVSKEEINPLRIFVVVRDFLGMLDQVCRELKTLRTPRSPNPLAPFR